MPLTRFPSHFMIIEGYMFRDRFELRPDRGNTKIIPLRIFNLLVNKPSVTLIHNPLVGGLRGPVKSSRVHHPFKINKLGIGLLDIYLVLLNYFLV